MKIAILSDIKSNVYALEEIIKDAKNKEVDLMINLGDSFYGAIEPRATFDLLKKNNFINICGDEDRKILEASEHALEKDKTLKYVYEDLGEEVLYWIQDLPFEKFINDDVYITHGTQHNDSLYLLEEVINNQSVLRDEKKIIELIDDVESRFVFCGNSLKPRCINLSNKQIVINPGSAGIQAYINDYPKSHIIENNYTEATYIILDLSDENYNIELVRISYDYEKAALRASQNGRDDIAYSLRTGKVFK